MIKPHVVSARSIRKVLGEGAGQVEALKGVSLTVHNGELTLLMGPSGSGKTTLLSILGCLLRPTEGSLTIAGNDVNAFSPEQLAGVRREHIGFVFQSYNLFPTLTATENVALALDVRKVPVRESRLRALETLEAVDLSHRADAYPRTLSGGEKQRVAIARALVANPSLILADEPTSALDAENGQAVMALLAEVAQSPDRAVLAVTHDHRIESYADRVVRIEDGLIISSKQKSIPTTRAKAVDNKVVPISSKRSAARRSSKPKRSSKAKR